MIYQRFAAAAKHASSIQKKHLWYAAGMAALLLASSASLFSLSPYRAGARSIQFFRATVVSVRSTATPDAGPEQLVTARLLDGPQKHRSVPVLWSTGLGDAAAKRLPIGSEVLLTSSPASAGRYSIVARWYMPGIATLFIILLALAVAVGAWRGITSVFGLSLSIAILAVFVIPRIVNGHNAFAACIEGAVLITLVSVYIAHGFTKRTTVAFAGSLLTLGSDRPDGLRLVRDRYVGSHHRRYRGSTLRGAPDRYRRAADGRRGHRLARPPVRYHDRAGRQRRRDS
ncbi:MAG: YibE/F family protein [Candidatus Saccharibacteria bacterium]